MITRNIDVEDGLVNGTFGKIARIIIQTENAATTVNKLGLVLDNSNAGQRYRNESSCDADNLVYIERVEENLRQKEVVPPEVGFLHVQFISVRGCRYRRQWSH